MSNDVVIVAMLNAGKRGLADKPSYCPHSKHRILYFEVIRPQYGHILRDPKSPTRGLNLLKGFAKD
jgi:hypothetical protein